MDELERRIRAARPLSGHRHLPLSDRAKRELADLLLTEPRLGVSPVPPRTKTRRHVGAWLAVAGVAASATVPLVAALTTHPAHAATPPLLTTTPVPGSASDQLLDASANVTQAATPNTNGAVRIVVQTWTLELEDNGTATSATVVPQNYDITQGTDGARSMLVTAGHPFDRDGQSASGEDVPHEGDLLWQQDWGPDEYLPLFSTPLPDDPAAIGDFLSNAIGADHPLSAAEVIQTINDLLLEQQLDPSQESALLRHLASLDGIEFEGSTHDRLGRQGVVLSARNPAQPDYTQHLVISSETGQILATETIYVGTSRTDIASPSVVNYYAWNRSHNR